MILLDSLRPPTPFDASRGAYKDWFHLLVFDHAGGNIVLVNTSLHGAPDEATSRAVGAALLHSPSLGWIGNIDAGGVREATITGTGIATRRVALTMHHRTGSLSASAEMPEDGLRLRIAATAETKAVTVEEHLPLGDGWISWYAVPRLGVTGTAGVFAESVDLTGASAYYDHNWGRWHWGDDLGWEWGCFLAPSAGPTFILTRLTNKDHSRVSSVGLLALVGETRRAFQGDNIQIEYSGRLPRPARRVPGSLAALHADRVAPNLPVELRIRANRGADHVRIDFTSKSALQLITADPAVPGYTFMHEITGSFVSEGRLGQQDLAGAGLAVFEYVD